MGNLQSFLKVIKKEVQAPKVGESEAKEPKSRPKKQSKKEVSNGK